MRLIKCPNCGKVFSVDEADYAAIVSQVRNAEFDAEIQRRMNEVQERQKTEQELATEKAKQTFQTQLNQKELELGNKDAEIERLKGEKDSEIARVKSEKDLEIALLKSQLENIDAQKKSELTTALAEKDREIATLNSTISQSESKLQLAVMEERNKAQQTVQEKETEITQLRSAVDYYRDLKTKLTTKMVGETLEQHCSYEFENYIRPLMPNAYFDKDNEVREGTKGDFIFRDYEDEVEYISIMFEMKNENDTTSTKHKNDDFLKKLDEDRKKKGCEFAVLVSLLEADNELYNTGIVNKSHLYPKMYVIRPQFFVPFINLLVQASKKSLEYKKQLVLAQSKEVDVTNFEKKLEDFKKGFGNNYRLASEKFKTAIEEIDKSIDHLQKTRKALLGSEDYLRIANDKAEDLTIRSLTYKNSTMREKFKEARKANEFEEIVD